MIAIGKNGKKVRKVENGKRNKSIPFGAPQRAQLRRTLRDQFEDVSNSFHSIDAKEKEHEPDFEIHICWKVDNEARMDPPIQTEYFRSGGATILTYTSCDREFGQN